MRVELPKYFDALPMSPLTEENIQKELPDSAQGAYLLFLDDTLVYVGKTDAQAGFRSRLGRHLNNVRHRKNLDPDRVMFKAVRIFVFSNFDLEAMLIEEYTKHRGARPTWNYSGFGSNDPGRNREGQKPANFDLDYPVDIDREVSILSPGEHELMAVALALKSALPYLFRYETGDGTWRTGHADMRGKKIILPDGPLTTRTVLHLILDQLPADDGWRVTILPNRVILYPEEEGVSYKGQQESLRKS